MDPRYQIFLSSTFRDLREERQAALEAILELGHFPAGMEAFPAADATPWDLIQTIISESDYYILIVGGTYGSTGPEGISYTEMEFDLAEKLGKPIIAFMHQAPDEIPAGKSELEPEARIRLQAFRGKVGERLWKGWRTREDLKSSVVLGLTRLFKTKPAFGWIRNEGLQNQELLQRLALLQSKYDKLESEANELRSIARTKINSDHFQALDNHHLIPFRIGSEKEIYTATTSWSDLFFGLADEMLIPASEYASKKAIKTVIAASLEQSLVEELTKYYNAVNQGEKLKRLEKDIEIEDETLLPILRQLMAKALIEPQMVLRQEGENQRTFTTSQRCWTLTPLGREKYLEKRAFHNQAAALPDTGTPPSQ